MNHLKISLLTLLLIAVYGQTEENCHSKNAPYDQVLFNRLWVPILIILAIAVICSTLFSPCHKSSDLLLKRDSQFNGLYPRQQIYIGGKINQISHQTKNKYQIEFNGLELMGQSIEINKNVFIQGNMDTKNNNLSLCIEYADTWQQNEEDGEIQNKILVKENFKVILLSILNSEFPVFLGRSINNQQCFSSYDLFYLYPQNAKFEFQIQQYFIVQFTRIYIVLSGIIFFLSILSTIIYFIALVKFRNLKTNLYSRDVILPSYGSIFSIAFVIVYFLIEKQLLNDVRINILTKNGLFGGILRFSSILLCILFPLFGSFMTASMQFVLNEFSLENIQQDCLIEQYIEPYTSGPNCYHATYYFLNFGRVSNLSQCLSLKDSYIIYLIIQTCVSVLLMIANLIIWFIKIRQIEIKFPTQNYLEKEESHLQSILLN